MRSIYYLILITTAIKYSAFAQSTDIGYIERITNKADQHFKEGSYQKAVNLYKTCLNHPYLTNTTYFQAQIKKAEQIIKLDESALNEIRSGNKGKALVLFNQILLLNPNDPYTKFSQKEIKEALSRPQLTQADKFYSKALEHIKNGDWEKAYNLLNVIKLYPPKQKANEVAQNMRMVNELMSVERQIQKAKQNGNQRLVQQLVTGANQKYPESLNSKALTLPKQPTLKTQIQSQTYEFAPACTVTLKNAEESIGECGYLRAAAILVKGRQDNYECTQDSRLTRKLAFVREVQSLIEIVQGPLKSDATKRQIVTKSFDRLMKLTPYCIREDYFNYVYNEAVTHKLNGNCASSIISFERAKHISTTLARKYKIDDMISQENEACNCKQKAPVVVALVRKADELYNSCQCDSAVVVWNSAKSYLCTTDQKSNNLWNSWQVKEKDCIDNKAIASNFQKLLAEGNELLSNSQCTTALNKFKEAQSLSARCGQLNKPALDSAIVNCHKCSLRIKFDSTMTKATRSLANNYLKDALRFYRYAYDSCAPPAERRMNLMSIIKTLECKVEGLNCPPEKPKDSTTTIIPNFLFKLSIVGGGHYIFPKLTSSTFPTENVRGWLGFSSGLRIDYITFKSPFSAHVDIAYNKFQILMMDESHKLVNERNVMGFGEIGFGIKIHSPKKELGRPRGFIDIGYSFMLPVNYKYINYLQNIPDTNTESLNANQKALKAGIGFEIQRKKFGISIQGGVESFRSDLFNQNLNRSTANPRNFSTPNPYVIGLKSAFRFW